MSNFAVDFLNFNHFSMKRILLLFLISPLTIFAQINISNGVTYSQNFDGLGSIAVSWTNNTNLVGWYAAYGLGSATVSLGASTGSSTTGALYSFGAANATERALGSLASGGTGTIYYGLRLKNNSDEELKSITITYTGEQWRRIKDAPAHTLSFSYRVSATEIIDIKAGTWINESNLAFTTSNIVGESGALDGNLAENRTTISYTINVSVPVNSEIMLRWVDIDDGGNDMGFGIDDLSITAYNTLPISLTTFTAKPIDKTILLNWKTASEKRNKSFDLQRSADGKNFTTITSIDGAGDSDVENSYSFVDENPYAGINYYKLVQYDFNGQSTSKIIEVDSKIEKAKMNVFATQSSVDVNIVSPNRANAKVYLYDLEGSRLAEKSISLTKGNNALSFAQSLAPGIYFVSLSTAEGMVSTKFAKWQ